MNKQGNKTSDGKQANKTNRDREKIGLISKRTGRQKPEIGAAEAIGTNKTRKYRLRKEEKQVKGIWILREIRVLFIDFKNPMF